MDKFEFQDRTDKPFTDTQYKVIEFVYTFHPAISNVDGKQQIAHIFSAYGFRVIRDMLPTAEKCKVYLEEITALKMQLSRMEADYKEYRDGSIDRGED